MGHVRRFGGDSHILVLLALLLMPLFGAQANESIIVANPDTGQNVYEIVYASDKGDVDLKPGVYAINRDGSSTPVVLGNVLGVTRGFNGIVAQFTFGSSTNDTGTSLAVVNGQLTLFNRNSKPNARTKKAGALGVGSFRLHDPLIGIDVQSPVRLDSLQDLNLYEGPRLAPSSELPNGGQLVVFSIKAANTFGNGITGAFLLEGQAGPTTVPKIFNERAYVLNYEFLPEEVLSRVVVADRHSGGWAGRLYSETLAKSFLERYKDQLDNVLVKKWISHVGEFARNRKKPSNSKDPDLFSSNGVPLFNIFSQKIEFATLPAMSVGQEGVQLFQVFDPVTDRWAVYDRNGIGITDKPEGQESKQLIQFAAASHIHNGSPVIEGKVSHDKKGQYRVSEISENDSHETQHEYLISIGNKTVLLLRSQHTGELRTVTLPNIDMRGYKKVEILHKRISTDKYPNIHYILMSVMHANTQKSVYGISLQEDHNGKFVVNYDRMLMSGFISREELALRSKIIHDDAEKNTGLYVDITSKIAGAAAYKKALDPKLSKEKLSSSQRKSDVVDQDVENSRLDQSRRRLRRAKRQGVYYFMHPISANFSFNGAFLRAAKAVQGISNGKVRFLQFGDKRADRSATGLTGFYLDYDYNFGSIDGANLNLNTPATPTNVTEDNFIPGYPLYENKKKVEGPLALDIADIKRSKGEATLTMAVVPYSPLPVPETSKFRVLLTLYQRGPEKHNTTAVPVQINLPFQSLIGAQIIQGVRESKDQFHVLFFFGKNPGDQAGVYSMSGSVDTTYKNGSYELVINLKQTGTWLTKESTNPSELRARLKADAKGEYYWIDNPEEPLTSLKLRVRDLNSPARLIYVNREDGRRVRLRFEEELSEDKGKSDLYARWSVISGAFLERRFPRFGKYIETLKAKFRKDSEEPDYGGYGSYYDKKWLGLHEPSSPYFVQYLEKLAKRSEKENPPKRQIILVEEKMKEVIMNDMMMHLSETGEKFTVSYTNRDFEFYVLDSASSAEESLKELTAIREKGKLKQTMLFSSLDDLLGAREMIEENDERPVEEPPSENEEEVEEEEAPKKKPLGLSRWLMLATDGDKYDLKKVRGKVKFPESQIPMMIIGTPQEFNQVIARHEFENKLGVFDQFEINNQFLTSSWMQWPPGSRYATDEVNDFAKTPISEEEHRVFPDIEKLFVAAANGDYAGQQITLIVSEELKPLIQKLIMTRWSTPVEKMASDWHYSNEDLVMYKLQGSRNENTQDQSIENFMAMRGAADHKNVVFYGDLEHIRQIRRPFNAAGPQFQIVDPVLKKAGDNALQIKGNKTTEDLDSLEAHPALFQYLQQDRKLVGQQNQLEMSLADLERDYGILKNNGSDTRSVVSQVAELKQRIREVEESITLNREYIEHYSKDQAQELDRNNSEQKTVPHLMWLVASEGQKIQPKAERNWSLAEAADRKYATILLGTRDEWNAIEQDMGFESKYLDLESHFKVVELTAPSDEVKYDLVRSLVERPEIRSMDYSFQIEGQNSEEAQRQLIYHFINRVEQIANSQGLEGTSAFVKAFSELREVLINDVGLRRSRVIDRKFMERLFFKIFPLPISLDNLEKEDPLNKLNNIPEASRKLQQLGYHGSMVLKNRTLDTILSQTRSSDPGRPIPNSQIFFGDTSTGKTFLFMKIVELLGLEPYDALKASNEEADYIVIKVQNIIEEKSRKDQVDRAGEELYTFEEVKERIEDLLSQPKGHRAFILFDDAHKTASASIHQDLFSFIQSLFEAPNGVLRVRKKGTNEYKEVPVQNLNLYMTVNPTSNKEQRQKYEQGQDLNKSVLAALAKHDIDMEESILARWSDIINLDGFPRGAKVPALVEKIRKSSSTGNATVLVDPEAINRVVGRFPNANAREFLIPAASAITKVPSTAEPANLYLVTPRPGELPKALESTENERGHFLTTEDLRSAVAAVTQVDAIRPEDPNSIVKLIQFLLGNFRMQAYNQMILTSQNSEELLIDLQGQGSVVQRSFLMSVMTHLLNKPTLAAHEVRVLGGDFGFLEDLHLEELVEILGDQRRSGDKHFPFDLGVRKGISSFDPNSFMGEGSFVESNQFDRQSVMEKTMIEVEDIFRQMLQLHIRSETFTLNDTLHWEIEDIVKWYEELPTQDPQEQYQKLSRRLVEAYKEFIDNLNHPDLAEMRDVETVQFSMYDQGRLFAYIVDKAMTRLPWGAMSKFVLDVVGQSSDLSLGQKPNYIRYAYQHQYSPLAIITSDFLNETYAQEVSDSKMVKQLDQGFQSRCERALTRSPNKNGGT